MNQTKWLKRCEEAQQTSQNRWTRKEVHFYF